MRLPTLNELSTSRDMVDVFGGYNHNLRINDGEFYDMQNLTSAHYPLLAPRQQRGVYERTTSHPVGLIEKDALCYVTKEGTNLYFYLNGDKHDLGLTSVDAEVERTLTSMGAYVIIMPDRKYISTVVTKDEDGNETREKGDIETKFPSADVPEDATTIFTLCKMDGTAYIIDMTSAEEPESTEDNPLPNGYTWLDTGVSPASLKQYSDKTGMWSSVATTYIKIECVGSGLGKAFKEYDGITLSGITVPSLEEEMNDKSYVIYAKGDDYIVVVGILDDATGYTQNGWIGAERWMPEMDFLIESNNRLWGCRYGLNRDGNVVNELYACKLGDFKNWNCFMGISTDSYYVSLGTDGQFTGAISYLGMPTFFKENCLHTVYGSYPAEYQVQDTACRGVQRGSEKSLAMVNEVLYYKSRTGICAYSGSLPAEVSAVLGDKSYSKAVATAHKGKYYVSMCDISSNEYVLFVYDTEKGLWHKEDSLEVKAFCPAGDEIYYIDAEKCAIKTLLGSGTKDTIPVKWMAETGVLGISSPDKKYVSRLTIRLSMDIGARIVFKIQYDSSGVWESVCALTSHNLRTFTLPIRPKRCDHFKLRIEGEGNAKVFSISKITEQGSDE